GSNVHNSAITNQGGLMANAKPIREGFHTLTPALIVKNAGKAIDFYKKVFDAQELSRFEMPGTGKIMHAEVKIGDSMLMLAEEMPEQGCVAPSSQSGTPPVSLYLYVENVDTVFNRAVESGAKVRMAVADMFWGDRWGQFADPDGQLWSVATHKEDVPDAEMGKRAQEFMKSQKK